MRLGNVLNEDLFRTLLNLNRLTVTNVIPANKREKVCAVPGTVVEISDSSYYSGELNAN